MNPHCDFRANIGSLNNHRPTLVRDKGTALARFEAKTFLTPVPGKPVDNVVVNTGGKFMENVGCWKVSMEEVIEISERSLVIFRNSTKCVEYVLVDFWCVVV